MRISNRQQLLPASHVDAPQPAETSCVGLIRAQTLIPGRGEPIHNGCVAIKGGKIEWVGSYHDCPDEYREIKPTHVKALMPGLWDCHVHFMGLDVVTSINGMSGYLPGQDAMIGAATVDDFRATLMAGYTSVRELEGYGNDIWPLVKNGTLVGPNVYSSVSAMSITGGHGDDHTMPLSTVLEAMNHTGSPIGICDGVDECIKTVRKMVRRGARVIKVCSSGGVLSLNDDPEDRQFSDEELAAIVQEAARSRRAVAAHAIGKAGIMAGLRAGVKSIEHGMYLDEEVVALMKEKDAIFVGTQHIVRQVSSDDYLSKVPPPVQEKILKLVDKSKSSYRLAIKEGVKIAFGTDMISSDRASELSHGNNAKEILHAVELGMTPLQAIESATATGPETLGGMAPLSGQLKAGYDADIIALSSDPVKYIDVLADPKNITHVWKGGKLFKSPSRYSTLEAEDEEWGL